MRIRHLSLLAIVVVTLTGCLGSPRLRANVEAFSALTAAPAAVPVAVLPMGAQDQDGLEFQRHRESVEAALTRRGFKVVSPADERAWVMRLGYGIDGGRQIVEERLVPGYGYPFDLSRRYRRHYDPFWRSRFRTELRTRTVFTRHLELALDAAPNGDEVWRSRVVSTGSCATLSAVFDEMLVAAFNDFPNAGTRRLDVELQDGC